MKRIIDRFEEEYAVCELENGETINIPRKDLPPNVKVGMVLNGLEIDFEETEKIRKRIKGKMDKLFAKESEE